MTDAEQGSSRGREDGTFIVQQSFPRPRATTNPYIVMLGQALDACPGVSVRTFSWREALFSRSDVFHVHWPEILVSGRTPLRRLVRQALTLALLAKLTVTRTPVVRTLHNLERSSGETRRERWILGLVERRTALSIRLNDETPTRAERADALIEHGHYRDWFAPYPKEDATSGRSAFIGLIRPYKGVERLIEVFHDVPGEATLTVSGKASGPGLAAGLEGSAAADPRIHLDLRYVPDSDFVAAVTSASLVVLPYREMHNSGGVLAALSLDRPVLVPANPVTDRLALEVGEDWVLQYSGDLDADDIVTALEQAEALSPLDRPDLSRRDWAATGAQHVEAYRRAVRLMDRRRSDRRRNRQGVTA